MNKVSGGLVAVSTPREILEVNMALLLHPSSWSDRAEDEAEFDILKMQEATGSQGTQVGTSTIMKYFFQFTIYVCIYTPLLY